MTMPDRALPAGLLALAFTLPSAIAQEMGAPTEQDPMAPPVVEEAGAILQEGMQSGGEMTTADELGFEAMTDEELDAFLAGLAAEEEEELVLEDVTNAAEEVHHPGHYAPAGVLQDHLHKKGEWMLSYRYMRQDFGGNRNRLERVEDADVVSTEAFGFSVAPTQLTVDTHLFGVMYGLTDRVTVAAIVPFVEQEMDYITRAGDRYTTESSGIADVTLAALVQVYQDDHSRAHVNLGLSAPTGSITESDAVPGSGPGEAILPYAMQLGSGTWDLRPGFTYTGQQPGWSWGTQAIATLRLGRNDRDYSLGDRIDMTAWTAWHPTDTLALSTRLALSRVKNVDGADAELDASADPAADPRLRAGSRLDAFVGVSSNLGAGNRLAIEAGWPLSQALEGPQLEIDTMVTIGWQLSF